MPVSIRTAPAPLHAGVDAAADRCRERGPQPVPQPHHHLGTDAESAEKIDNAFARAAVRRLADCAGPTSAGESAHE